MTELREQTRTRREQLRQARERALRLLQGGATSLQAAAAMTEAVESLLRQMIDDVLTVSPEVDEKRLAAFLAVVAVGGTGRGDMAPFSDLDLLLLRRGPLPKDIERWVDRLIPYVYDVFMYAGHAVRSVEECLAMAEAHTEVATGLIDARCLWGREREVQRMHELLRRHCRRRYREFVERVVAERTTESGPLGMTAQQLEPDLKCSAGGLRDAHLIRWIAFARHGTTDIDTLRLKGVLGRTDARRLVTCYEYLLRLRFELHARHGKPHDVLTREDQQWIAAARGFRNTPARSDVEQFMQEYFQHSMELAELARRFVSVNRPVPWRVRTRRAFWSRRVGAAFLIRPDQLDVVRRRLPAVCSDLNGLLRIYDTAAAFQVPPAPLLEERIKQSVASLPERPPTSDESRRFLRILSFPGRQGQILRSMYSTGTLERVLPEFRRIRCLLQVSHYHRFTVDEHTLRVLEAADELLQDTGSLGSVYRSIRHKELLHLAMLLHDIGKGESEDHCVVGERIAHDVARRMQLRDAQRELLATLVRHHLLMADVAFRQDIQDPSVLQSFARILGSPEALRMLYVLTAADLIGVGPHAWTKWKAELLENLFENAMVVLSGMHSRFYWEQRLHRVTEQVRTAFLERTATECPPETALAFLEKELPELSPNYLMNTPPERIAADLAEIRTLQRGEIRVIVTASPETQTIEYRVITDVDFSEGCSHRIAGALTALSNEILSAQITTTRHGKVIDSFRVRDVDAPDGHIPEHRRRQVVECIERVVRREVPVEELFRRFQRFGRGATPPVAAPQPTRVVVDADSAELCTVVTVFAHDRPGLLYTICRAAFDLGISIQLAKIATSIDQVADVFYVTDLQGRKITDPERLQEIRQTLTDRLTEFELKGYKQFQRPTALGTTGR
ncbi:MAG: [protein-PII] uridylyltransferase [Planctomycetota bacterium]|nr:MAG: [protein-PII] uridylyltransferase [Planctomycetota bacterium]